MWIFSLLVVLMGLCMAATLYDPCFAIMLRKLKSDGPRAVASVTLIAGFATLVTFPLVIGLSAYIEWRQIIQVFALMAMAGLFLLPSDTGAENPSSLRIAANMPLTKAPILIAFSFGLVMLSHAILLFLLPVALSEESTNASLLALAILGPAQISGRIVWHYAGASLRPQNAAIYMFICLCAPASILLIVGTTPLALFTALSIQGACYGVHTILRPSLAQIYVATDQLGRSLGLIAMVGLLMMACGPALGGLIWSHTGLSGLLGTLLFLNCTAILLGLILRSAPQRRRSYDLRGLFCGRCNDTIQQAQRQQFLSRLGADCCV